MKKAGILLIITAITILANGQTIKIQVGTSISKLDWQLKGMNIDPFFNETSIGFSIFAGLDYLDKQSYNLSSNIGMVRKGGKGKAVLTGLSGDITGQTITEKPTLDYLSVNTKIDLKYRIKGNFAPFVSFGPRLDYLLNSSKHFDSLDEIDELKSTSVGLILGGGLKYEVSGLQFELGADYYLDFTKIADWTIESTGISGKVTVDTFTLNMSIGYKIK